MLADLMLEVQREIKSCRSSITSLMSPLMIRLNQDPSSSSTAASSFVSAAASLATYPGIDAKSGGPSVTDSTSTTNPIAPTVMNVKPSSHRRGRTQSRQASFVNSLPSLEDFGVFQNELTSATLADLAASEPLHSSPLPMTTGGSPSTTLAMPTPVPSLSLSSSQQKAKKPQPQSDEAFSDSLTSCIITGLLPTLSEGHDEKQLTKSPSVQVASPSAMQSFTPMHHPSLSPLPPPRAISSSLMPSTSSCISSPTNANDCHPLAVMQMMSQSLQQLEKRVALYEKEWPQLVGMLLFHDERLTRLEMGMVDDGDDEIDVAAGPLSDDPLALDALQQGPEAALSPFSAQLALWEKRDRKRKAKDRRAKAGSLPDNKRQQQQQPPQQLLPSSPLLFEPVTHADSVSSLHSACSSASDGSSAAAVAGWSATIDEDDYEEGDDEEEEYNDEEEYDDEEEEEEDGQDDRSLLPPSSSIGSITAKRGSWAYCDEATVQSLARDIRALHARVEAQDGEWHRKYCDLHEEVLQHMFGHLSDHDARYP
ncbi:hypothetical protein BGZ73_002319 [Actinomortierella ambigua]|nr:hypothetical protein BGZ73_002319 [Actinomortierella ambigua]